MTLTRIVVGASMLLKVVDFFMYATPISESLAFPLIGGDYYA